MLNLWIYLFAVWSLGSWSTVAGLWSFLRLFLKLFLLDDFLFILFLLLWLMFSYRTVIDVIDLFSKLLNRFVVLFLVLFLFLLFFLIMLMINNNIIRKIVRSQLEIRRWLGLTELLFLLAPGVDIALMLMLMLIIIQKVLLLGLNIVVSSLIDRIMWWLVSVRVKWVLYWCGLFPLFLLLQLDVVLLLWDCWLLLILLLLLIYLLLLLLFLIIFGERLDLIPRLQLLLRLYIIAIVIVVIELVFILVLYLLLLALDVIVCAEVVIGE